MTDKKDTKKETKAPEKQGLFNIDELTLADLEDFEEKTGHNLLQVIADQQDGGAVPAKALRGLMWIIKRQQDPDVTFESLRNEKLTLFTELVAPS